MRPWRLHLAALVLSNWVAEPYCRPSSLRASVPWGGGGGSRYLGRAVARPCCPRGVRDVGSSSDRRGGLRRVRIVGALRWCARGPSLRGACTNRARRWRVASGVGQDSEHGAVLLFTADARAQPLRFEWSRDLGDRVLRLRTTYRVQTTERFTIETELSPDDGHTWQLVARLDYHRRGSQASTGTQP